MKLALLLLLFEEAVDNLLLQPFPLQVERVDPGKEGGDVTEPVQCVSEADFGQKSPKVIFV